MRRLAMIAAALAALFGLGLASAAFGQSASERATAHEKSMKEGKDHEAARLATPQKSDAAETTRKRAEHEAAMKKGMSHSSAQQNTTPKGDTAAVTEKAKRHAESMQKGKDHAAAALDSDAKDKR
jgi:hypothetical protein